MHLLVDLKVEFWVDHFFRSELMLGILVHHGHLQSDPAHGWKYVYPAVEGCHGLKSLVYGVNWCSLVWPVQLE
jgi:hypothetical protein